MALITQEAFTALIEAVRLQTLKDRSNAITLAEMFNSDGINSYDNSILIKAIVSHLQTYFPKKDNHCEIEHYMFDMNFGKVGEKEVVTIEDLWFRLNNTNWFDNEIKHNSLPSFHPLIDDETGHVVIRSFKE